MASQLGKGAFIIGAVLAVILGILEGVGQALGTNAWLVLLLVVLGLIVGFVNIKAKEVQPFLVAAIAITVTAVAANLGAGNTLFDPLGSILVAIVNDIVLVIAPAALVVAGRAAYGFAAE